MRMSDVIAAFIADLLSEGGGVAQLQRKRLADQFACAPSQINYVIETRFTPEAGYLVESQRGGGGYIRIVRMMDDKAQALVQAAGALHGGMRQKDAVQLIRALVSAELLSEGQGRVLISAVSDTALSRLQDPNRLQIRTDILRASLLSIAT